MSVKDSDKIKELYEKHVELRQERLNYCNLIAVAQDEINVLSSLNKARLRKCPSNETLEIFELLKRHHEDSVEELMLWLDRETELLQDKEHGLDSKLYIVELEQILLEKIKNCEFSLNVIRAVKLTYN